MNQWLIFCGFFFLSCSIFAQVDPSDWDTTGVIDMGNGGVLIITASSDDTLYTLFRDNHLEYKKRASTGIYQRYYTNGQLMWEQSTKDGKANGTMKFFDPNGTHVGTLQFRNDTLVDTLFLRESRHFVFGRFTYSSKIHGGIRRPDGTSNISEGKGNKSYAKMYAVKHSKTNPAKKYAEFTTDNSGYFFFMAEEGSFGIFPDYYKIEDVTSNMGTPQERNGPGSRTNWNVTDPIKISNNFCYLPLHLHSVGYAP